MSPSGWTNQQKENWQRYVSPGLARISTRNVISLQAFTRTWSIMDYDR